MKNYFLAIILLSCIACQQQVPVNDIVQIPVSSIADSVFVNVYNSLHGKWVGDLEVFRDDDRGPRNEEILYDLSPAFFNQPNLNSIQLVKVYQRFESQTPYFQKIDTQDHYLENDKSVIGQGANKVQDGKMWRVIQKPDETIIFQGSLVEPGTIIWQRNEQNPQKIEYFRETVSGDRYTIMGWGYYEGDDISLMPHYWYYGLYYRDY